MSSPNLQLRHTGLAAARAAWQPREHIWQCHWQGTAMGITSCTVTNSRAVRMLRLTGPLGPQLPVGVTPAELPVAPKSLDCVPRPHGYCNVSMNLPKQSRHVTSFITIGKKAGFLRRG